MVLAFKDNHYAAVNVPAGEIFDVIAPAEDDRFVVVDVKGHQSLVFDSDLKGRGKPVAERKVQSAA
jgi:hypothetical protein